MEKGRGSPGVFQSEDTMENIQQNQTVRDVYLWVSGRA